MLSTERRIYDSIDPINLHEKVTEGKVLNKDCDVNSIKQRLQLAWAEVLHDEPSNFSDEDVFFEVGGDSRLAQKLVVVANKHGICLTIQEIFNNASLREMTEVARVVEETSHEGGETLDAFELLSGSIHLEELKMTISTQCSVSPSQIQNAYPCTPMQESLIGNIEGEDNSYLRQFVFKLSDNVHLDSFRAAWTATIEANPVLRTRICSIGAKSGYLQVVINEVAKFGASCTSLLELLKADENAFMALGDPLSRYTFTVDGDGKDPAENYFVWTVHHAICDGVSILEVISEVAKRYRNESIIERQSFDLFVKQVTTTETISEQEFWTSMLGDKSPTPYPQLPQNVDFQPVPSSRTTKLLELKPGLPTGITKSNLLRAAWAILSSHLTGTEEVVFGAINDGRGFPMPGMAQLTGPTINLVPVALKVDPKQSVHNFLSQVQQQAVSMMAYEHGGISHIRRYLAGKGNTTTNFQTLFIVHPMDFSDAILPATNALGLEYLHDFGKKEQHSYSLVVTFTLSTNTTLELDIQHDPRVISAQQTENLTHQFQTVLSQLSHATEDKLVGSITSLSQHDIDQIRQWNKYIPLPERTTIHQLFHEQVLKAPYSPAVCDSQQAFSYQDVDKFSSYLASELADFGIKPGVFVGVCFEKSIWTVVAILAVFKAGGVYVPIDPAHPRTRILEVINTVKIGLVVTSATGSNVLDGINAKIVVLSDKPSPRAGPQLPMHSTTNTAYLLFTSGTTGKPKGILMSHTAICTSIIHHGAAYGAGPHWRTLQFGAHTFDLSIAEFFTTLAFGGCICVPSEHDRMNNLGGVITTLEVNTLLVVPTVANLLFPRDVPTLKTIVLAGEPITKETIVRWANHVDLTAGYGPSETAVYCSGNLRVSPDADPTHIGKNIGAAMWIVNPDNYHELSAVGCIGEIVISGALLGEGYFNDKVTTEAAFVPAPQWLKDMDPESPYDMLYRSGDLARYTNDGNLHIVGRRDTQVKLRGFRIELGEIENQIMAHGGISAALAHLPNVGSCAKQIVALLSFHHSDLQAHHKLEIMLSKQLHSQTTKSKLKALKNHLVLNLPTYMIPSIWIVLDKMPLLISGKIDRKALKSWVNSMDYDTYKQLIPKPEDDDSSTIAPGSSADLLRQIWSDVLCAPVAHIGLGTSFFALGGDSISAIQIVARAKNLGLYITVRAIILGETLGHLATMVDIAPKTSKENVKQLDNSESLEVVLEPYEDILKSRLKANTAAKVQDAYPLSPFQREIMKQRRINPHVFILSWQMEVFCLSGPEISLEKLAKSWNLVVQKYPILRSIFLQHPRTGESLQVILSNIQPEIAISSASEDEMEPTFGITRLRQVDECFLPHRAHFIKHGNRYLIHIELDHLIIDGWSLKLIKAALLQAYENSDLLAEEAPSFKAFVLAHDQNRVEADNEYWASVLRDQKPSLLAFPVSSEAKADGNIHSERKTIIYLPELTSQALTTFSVDNSITFASIFNAAWAQTLGIYTQSPDASFEYVISGREENISGAFDIVGPLINTLPLHLRDISTRRHNTVLARLAQRIQEQQGEDSLHSSSNVREVIQKYLGPELLFNTALNFQRRPTAVELGGLKIDDNLRKSIDPWHFDVLVRVLHITDDNTFKLSLEFDARLFDTDRMKEVADDWWQRVNDIVL